VERADLKAFAGRDWRTVEAEKARFWAERKLRLPPDELFALVDRFRSHLQALRPDWPTEAERASDLAAHAELARRLASVRRQADR